MAGETIVGSTGRSRADVGIRDGRIAALGTELDPAGAEVLDATGCLVLPGAIDAHVHPIHAEDLGSTSEAAAFGGVTTLLHHICVEPGQGLLDALQAAREEGAGASRLDFGLQARLTEVPRRLDELPAAVGMGVRSFKPFTTYRSRGIMTKDGDLFRAMERISALGGLTLVHAENGAVIDVLEAHFREQGGVSAEDYPLTRPPEAEADAVNRVAEVAGLAGAPLYIVHISCAEALDAVVRARARGQKVYAETCSHYLTLTADEAMPNFGTKAKIAPPLRTTHDRDTLWLAVRDRRVDLVASDHSAFSEEAKTSPTVNALDVGFGAPGTETMLLLLHHVARWGVVGKRRSRSTSPMESIASNPPRADR
ncbi:MAG: dihydropyrimidinase [Planctomycetes bacterium]|nr:dihydropyrimidinase [Planctomycetota bacterium]